MTAFFVKVRFCTTVVPIIVVSVKSCVEIEVEETVSELSDVNVGTFT